MVSVAPLFSYPVMMSSEDYRFTQAEKDFIDGLEMAENVGNSMSVDDHILERPELQKVRQFIELQIDIYKRKVLRIKAENEIYITQSWANRSKANQHHARHSHPNSIISGVLFCSENKDKRLPPIRFHRTNELLPLAFSYEEVTDLNCGMYPFSPIYGRLMLFPSLLQHDVATNESDEERVTLSFNTFVRGIVGEKTHLTEVSVN